MFINDTPLHHITRLSISDSYDFIQNLQLTGKRAQIAEKIVREVTNRLGFLVNVGLSYLSLERSADSLSGGEAQRIRLASQIGAGLVGVMYVLDEPSIGLHQRDNARLLKTLYHLRDLGNTVIVVEHDEEAIRSADYIVDIGPGAGVHGGEIVAAGTIDDVLAANGSVTADFLTGTRQIQIPRKRTIQKTSQQLNILGACGNKPQECET